MSSAEEEGENSQGGRELLESSPTSPDTEGLISLDDIGARFQFCIAAVEDLERERDELISELTVLREPSLEAVQRAHEEVVQAFGQRARVELERDTLREEIKGARSRLFRVTKECVACQYQLENRRQELAQRKAEREELEIRAARLTEELTQLRDTFTQEREGEELRLRAPRSRRISHELQERRRLSADLQSLTEEQHNSLQDEYGPKLLQLLERVEKEAQAVRDAQDELLRLREQIRPLQGEACHLQVQKYNLHEQILLMTKKRGEEVLLYREQLQNLEDRRREIKISVQLQEYQNKELEELRKNLAKELAVYKGYLEIYGQISKSVTKKE
ncbi:PREDICTED: syncoilin [Nanorana parkeri]|uniref:syncoilin n=1 Tax=Nanorana parkeri TaxID=125878 RepID=UPI000854F384|nr:PREDICTED: syncoilin [Nanorana parkeri]